MKHLARASLAAIASALLMLIGLAHTASAQSSSGITLRVGMYGGSFAAAQRRFTADMFTKRTGIKVEFIEANASDHLTKLIASRGRESPYDLVYWDDDVQSNAISANVLQKIDPAQIPNLKFLFDEAKNKDGYGPGIIFVGVGIAYNKKKFEEAGIPAPTSWFDLWDPRLAGHVVIPDLNTIAGRGFLAHLSHLVGGDESTMEKGIQKIAEVKVHSYYSASSQIEALLTSGDAWAAPMVGGRAWGMIDRGIPLAYVVPKEKGIGAVTTVDIPVGAKHLKEVYAYLDFTLDPLPQLGQTYEIPYSPTSKLIGPIIAAYPDMAKKFPKTPEEVRDQFYLPNWTVYWKNHQRILDLWNRQVIRK